MEHWHRSLKTASGKLAGRKPRIFAERDRKLEAARQRRPIARDQARQAPGIEVSHCVPEDAALR
jgi:hypothetical protein